MVDGHRLKHGDRVYVAGHTGMVGSALWRELSQRGVSNLIGRTSQELDLRNQQAVESFFEHFKPDVVIIAAARVGGIGANSKDPVHFLTDNLRIQTNILEAADTYGVRRLLFLGSSCIYPRECAQPIKEEALLTGKLEPTNEAYAVAKISGIIHVKSLRSQKGRDYISVMPTNLYGPNDNFDEQTGHVLPALISKFYNAVATNLGTVTLWGTGTPRREFLHVEDLARAIVFLLENYNEDLPINVGTGSDVSIRELAELIAKVSGFRGSIHWDTSKPDGTPRKLLDTSRVRSLGWSPKIDLESGIRRTYAEYSESRRGTR